jgi:DNA polymerase II small subunit/DNA polymerase delta subunit B
MKEDIVRKALEAGIMLTPGLLETLDEKKLEEMIREAKQKDKTLLTEREKPSKSKLIIKVKRVVPKAKLKPEDFTKYYNNKYEGIKKLLLKKLDAVSINKVGESYEEISVIGMVKEPTPKGFVLEDPTGEIEVISNKEPETDDVIGVKGTPREGKLIGKEIILPDIPLDYKSKKIRNLSLLLTTSLTDKTRTLIQATNFTLIPKLGDENLNEKEKEQTITEFTNPTWITISTPEDEMNILVYNPEEEIEQKQAIDYLRKRHLSPKRNKILGLDDYFFIEPVPDILWLISPKKFLENYKGVTIISFEAPDAARIDLGTREVDFKKV